METRGRALLAWLRGFLPVSVAATGVLAILVATTGLTLAEGVIAALGITLLAALLVPGPDPAGEAGDAADDLAEPGPVRSQALLATLADPSLLLAADGTVLAFNAGAGDVADSLRPGQHISLALRYPDVVEVVQRVAASGEPGTAVLVQRVPVERRLSVRVAAVPQEAGSARPPLLLMTLRDLSAEQHLQQMRTDFVSNASHELRTPLAAMIGFIETLQGPAREDATARDRFLGIMATQAQRMRRLIEDLLSLSRVEMREHLRPSGRVDLAAVIADAVSVLEPPAKEAGIAIEQTPIETGTVVTGDRDELTQVFQNLIHNAIKYGRRGGRVSIAPVPRSASDPATIGIAVGDDGPGIAPQHLPRLTERFYRVDVESSRAKGGTGLGLAIVKHILNRHRGTLRITSQLGAGSTFTVLLPAAHGPGTGSHARR